MASKKYNVPKVKLNNGYEIPALGLGTYKVDSSISNNHLMTPNVLHLLIDSLSTMTLTQL